MGIILVIKGVGDRNCFISSLAGLDTPKGFSPAHIVVHQLPKAANAMKSLLYKLTHSPREKAVRQSPVLMIKSMLFWNNELDALLEFEIQDYYILKSKGTQSIQNRKQGLWFSLVHRQKLLVGNPNVVSNLVAWQLLGH